jgi:Uma2 family endonuclease
VAERLVAPESRYEVWDGRVEYVAPADEPHGRLHCKIGALLEAHVTSDYSVASDMLTRTSRVDDIAPDASVYPIERDPQTGTRRLEELAFEIASTESLVNAARKAEKLAARGVRRIFAVDVERQRVVEWSRDTGAWSILDRDGSIVDPTLAVPLPIAALVTAAAAKDAMAHALFETKNPVLMEHVAIERREARREGEAIGLAKGEAVGLAKGEAVGLAKGEAVGLAKGEAVGLAKGVVAFLDARKVALTAEQRARILGERDMARLQGWLLAATTCTDASELF